MLRLLLRSPTFNWHGCILAVAENFSHGLDSIYCHGCILAVAEIFISHGLDSIYCHGCILAVAEVFSHGPDSIFSHGPDSIAYHPAVRRYSRRDSSRCPMQIRVVIQKVLRCRAAPLYTKKFIYGSSTALEYARSHQHSEAEKSVAD